MPKIIRSSGVNIDDARPIILQRVLRGDDGASFTEPPDQLEQEASTAAPSRHPTSEQMAEALLDDARAQADALLAEARAQADRELSAARREGFDEGVAQGLQEIAIIKEDALRQIQCAVEGLKAERTRMIGELEADVVDLLFDVVDKVLSVEMKRSTEWILALVRNALAQLDSNESAVMKVGSQHYEKIAGIAAQLIAAGGRDKRLQVVQEAAYPPGACVIQSAKGVIDAGVETKLDKLKRSFKGNA